MMQPFFKHNFEAAEQEDVQAQFMMGLMYENGRGVPQDDREAVRWYRNAAEQGFAAAQFELGLMYRFLKRYFLFEIAFIS